MKVSLSHISTIAAFLAVFCASYPVPSLLSSDTRASLHPPLHPLRQQLTNNLVRTIQFDQDLVDHSPNDVLLLKVEAEPSSGPCGPVSLRLNGIIPSISWARQTGQGQDIIPGISEHKHLRLALKWTVDCYRSTESTGNTGLLADHSVQRWSVVVMAIDNVPVLGSKGFTVSARSKSSPNLLDIKGLNVPVRESKVEVTDDWLKPSDDRWMHVKGAKIVKIDRRLRRAMSESSDHIKGFETEVQALQRLIRQEESMIFNKFRSQCDRMRDELRQCNGIRCTLNTIGRHARDASNLLFRHSESVDITDLEKISLVPQAQTPIEPAEQPLSTTPDDNPASSTSELGVQPVIIPRQESRWLVFIKILAASLGLGILLSFIRRIYRSVRKRLNRLFEGRGQLDARAHHRTRHARWCKIGCFSCCARRRPRWRHRHQQPTNLDEKQRLVREQESVLNADMCAQVNVLCDQQAIHSEIQSMRQSYGFIDALIRAEEGRSNDDCRGRNCSGMGFSNILNILQANANNTAPLSPEATTNPYLYPYQHSRQHSRHHPHQHPPYATFPPSSTYSSRRSSQTSSPPPYGSWSQSQSDSEASTAPPEYSSEPDENDISRIRINNPRGPVTTTVMNHHVADGFRAYEPEMPTSGPLTYDFGASRSLTPVSSVPELSPRPSLESIIYGGRFRRTSDVSSNGDDLSS